MEYLKIKIADSDFKDKFCRIVLVDPKMNLYQFSIYIQILLKGAFCHMAMFKGKEAKFVDESWVADFGFSGVPAYDYTKVSIEKALEICSSLTFIYDTGDDYEFDLEPLGAFSFPLRKNLILLEAYGDGIWEDNHSGLYRYLKGEKEEIYAWNLKIPTGSEYDFYKPIDPEAVNEKLETERKKIIRTLKRNGCYSDAE